MKHIYIRIILLAVWLMGYGGILTAQQPNYTLTDNESGTTKEYVARDYVSMQPGFTYTATSSSNFNAKIDAGLLFPPADNYQHSDGSVDNTAGTDGAVVGSISGQFAVSPTGAATYTIPIECPAGINGMQPNISLTYNSQGGFGFLGKGWDITGLSSISRTTKSLHFDGSNGSTFEYNENDCLVLDGKKLILLSGTNLESGSIYGTENEDYTRVVMKTRTINGLGIKYFEVQTKDGKIIEYGENGNSIVYGKDISNNINTSITFSWRISKITDLDGNSIEYHYTNNAQVISEIEYALSNNIYTQKISFNYTENIVNPKTKYIGNFKTVQNQILTDVSIVSNGTELKKYKCNYDSDDKLTSIEESANGEKLPSTNFTWGTKKSLRFDKIATMSTTISELETGNYNLVYYNIADVNGDGYNDCIEILQKTQSNGSYEYLTYLIVNLYDKNKGSFSTAENTSGRLVRNIGYHYHFSNDIVFNKTPTVTIGDINNDGINEIVFVSKNAYAFEVSTSQNIKTPILKMIAYTSNDKYGSTMISQLFDANKDGINDLLLLGNLPYDANNTNHWMNNNTIFYGSENFDNIGLTDETSATSKMNLITGAEIKVQIGDFNSDNKMDFVEFENYSPDAKFYDQSFSVSQSKSWGQYLYNAKKMYTADFNNDGRSDIIVQMSDNKWKLFLNNGGVFKVPTIIDLPFVEASDNESTSYKDSHEGYVLDYDGDGDLDFVLADDNSYYSYNPLSLGWKYKETMWYFYKNTNGNFSLDKSFTESFKLPTGPISLADINNDGVTDIVFPYNNNYYAFYVPNATEEYVIKNIKTGLGQEYDINYKNISDYETGAIEGEVKYLRAPLLCVDYYNDIDGAEVSYKYNGGLVNVGGKGFLGFKNITSENSKHNVRTVIEKKLYSPSNELFLTSITVSTLDDELVSKMTKDYDFKIVDATKNRFIPIVNSETSKDYLKNLETVSNVLEYDDNWNITKTKNTSGGIITTTNTIYQKRSSKQGFSSIINPKYLPQFVEISKTNGTDTYIKKNSYSYNENGHVITETNDVGDINQVTTEYSNFDSFGHPRTVNIKAKNTNGVEKTRTSFVAYTPSGRFVHTKTNVLGETTTYNWDETRGVLNNETNHWGKTTSYTYDSWGQIKETRYPDSNRKTQVARWAGSSGLNGAKYYTYSEVSGSAPEWKYYDGLGREVAAKTIGLNANDIYTFTKYDSNGRKWKVSEPTFSDNVSSVTQWAEVYHYDDYNRVDKLTTPMGETNTVYNGLTTTVTTPEGSKTTLLNSSGLTESVTTNGKTVSYTYYPSGLTKTAAPAGGQALAMEYDVQGNRTKLTDPDAGVIESKYNGFGELVTETQKKADGTTDWLKTTNNYNDNGILQTIARQNTVNNTTETTTYTYDDDLGYKSRVKSIEIAGQHKQSFTYDDFSRVTLVTEEMDGKSWVTAKEYTTLGRVKKETYPSGYYTVNTYDTYGNLTQVTDKNGKNIWKAVDENAKGQLLHVQRGDKTTTFGYDDRGFPASIYAEDIQDMAFNFNTKGNLEYRQDNLTGQKEVFAYDNMNRLTGWNIYQNNALVKQNGLTYNTAGNIDAKSNTDGFTMVYGENGKPHALTSISGVPAAFPTTDLDVVYTDFKKIKTLTENGKTYTLTYGVDDERRKSVYTPPSGGGGAVTRYYLGNYEEKTDNVTGITEKIHYISGAIYIERSNGTSNLYYGYSDYLGSLTALTDADGNVVENYAYDPWGVRRNPTDWTLTATPPSGGWGAINRGYTGHEHLDVFGIINMNGRVYDPITASFFSPDPYVQAPDNWLNYNRYSYCVGNPFKYTDPSGNLLNFIWGLVIYSGISYLDNAQNNNWNWNPTQWQGTSFAIGYSYGFTDGASNIYGGISFDGYNYANIGTNFNGVTVGSTSGGFSSMQEYNNYWKSQGAPIPSENQDYGELNTFEPNGWEKFRDKSILNRLVYHMFDDPYVMLTNLVSPSTARHLDNSLVNDNDIRDAGYNTVVAVGTSVFGGEFAQLKNVTKVAEQMTTKTGVNTVEKASGSYFLKFESGKFYVGKGLEPRMMKSINRIETEFGDKLIYKTFKPASSYREAFIQEYKFMLETGYKPLHWDPNSMLYNKIWSPGKKLLGQ